MTLFTITIFSRLPRSLNSSPTQTSTDLVGFPNKARINLPAPLPYATLDLATNAIQLGASTTLTLQLGPMITSGTLTGTDGLSQTFTSGGIQTSQGAYTYTLTPLASGTYTYTAVLVNSNVANTAQNPTQNTLTLTVTLTVGTTTCRFADPTYHEPIMLTLPTPNGPYEFGRTWNPSGWNLFKNGCTKPYPQAGLPGTTSWDSGMTKNLGWFNYKHCWDGTYPHADCVWYYPINGCQDPQSLILINDLTSSTCTATQVAVRTGGCFSPETSILLENGFETRADTVRQGDVLYNPVTKQGYRVRKVVAGPEKIPLIELRYGTSLLRVTQTHPILTARGFVPAKNLRASDKVLGADENFHALEILRRLPVLKSQQVWNFELETETNADSDHAILAGGIVSGDLTIQKQLEKKHHDE